MSNLLAVSLVLGGALMIWAGWSGNYAKLQTLWGLNPSTVTASKGS